MTHGHTPESLIAFRDRVADAFREKRIRSPVHFPSDTQAEPLLRIFEGYREGDWCFSGWRSMWHCLLAGIPEDELFQMMLDGRSMYIQDKARRVVCSSIVGGILPIAVGVAMGIKRQRETLEHHTGMAYGYSAERYEAEKAGGPTVWVFVGDMTATTGLYHEAVQYAIGHGLPMRFVVENNGYSTNARTRETWQSASNRMAFIDGYSYERTMPHVGLAERVSF